MSQSPLLPTSTNSYSQPPSARRLLGSRRLSPNSANGGTVAGSGILPTFVQSEKARGKQRAVFLPDQEDEGSEQARIQKSSKSSDDDQEEQEEMNQPAGRMVTIRFTGQEVHGEGDDAGGGTGTDTDLDVWVEEGESVGRVIDKIRTLRPSLSHTPSFLSIPDSNSAPSPPATTATSSPSSLPYTLRLIHSGRLLTQGILLLPWLDSLNARYRERRAVATGTTTRLAMGLGSGVEDVLREVEGFLGNEVGGSSGVGRTAEGKANGKGKGKGGIVKGTGREGIKTEEEPEIEKTILHCVVGLPVPPPRLAAGPVTNPDSKPTSTSTSTSTFNNTASLDPDPNEPTSPTTGFRPRGFNALLSAGLSEGEIEAVRREFYRGRGEEVPVGFEADDEHVRALEEQWIEGDLTNETAQTTSEGIYTSTLQGLLIGFLFPLMAFSFFKEVPAPNFFDPFEIEEGRRGAGGMRNGRRLGAGSWSSGEDSIEDGLDGVPRRRRTRSPSTNERHDRILSSTRMSPLQATTSRPQTERLGRPFSLRGQPGGESVTGVAFGQRVQFAILLGTILNLAFGALRFLA